MISISNIKIGDRTGGGGSVTIIEKVTTIYGELVKPAVESLSITPSAPQEIGAGSVNVAVKFKVKAGNNTLGKAVISVGGVNAKTVSPIVDGQIYTETIAVDKSTYGNKAITVTAYDSQNYNTAKSVTLVVGYKCYDGVIAGEISDISAIDGNYIKTKLAASIRGSKTMAQKTYTINGSGTIMWAVPKVYGSSESNIQDNATGNWMAGSAFLRKEVTIDGLAYQLYSTSCLAGNATYKIV